jgi:hypothetical protein
MDEILDTEFKVTTYRSIRPTSRKIAVKRNIKFLIIGSTAIFLTVVFAVTYLLTNISKSQSSLSTKFFINFLIIFLTLFNCALIYTIIRSIKRFKKIYATFTSLEMIKTNLLTKNLYRELDEHTIEYIISEDNPKCSIFFTQSFFIYEELENFRYLVCQKKEIKLLDLTEHHKAFGEDLFMTKIEFLNLENKLEIAVLKLPANNMFTIILEHMGINL